MSGSSVDRAVNHISDAMYPQPLASTPSPPSSNFRLLSQIFFSRILTLHEIRLSHLDLDALFTAAMRQGVPTLYMRERPCHQSPKKAVHTGTRRAVIDFMERVG